MSGPLAMRRSEPAGFGRFRITAPSVPAVAHRSGFALAAWLPLIAIIFLFAGCATTQQPIAIGTAPPLPPTKAPPKSAIKTLPGAK